MHDADDSTQRAASDNATFMQKMRMLSGYPIGRALRFAVDLDLATILVDGPCTIEDLAAFTETDLGILERNIRRLESVGVFRVNGSTVEVTELGASLARDGGTPESASVPEPEPELAPTPEHALTNVPDQPAFPAQLPRRPEPAPYADDIPTGDAPTASISADDFPTGDTPTGDALVISSVLNDWTFDDFNRMLGTLAAATPPGGRLVLIELVLPADGVAQGVGDTDPLMVAALGGRGHTAAEWESVLGASGFRLERIRPGAPPFSFLEAVRA